MTAPESEPQVVPVDLYREALGKVDELGNEVLRLTGELTSSRAAADASRNTASVLIRSAKEKVEMVDRLYRMERAELTNQAETLQEELRRREEADRLPWYRWRARRKILSQCR